MFTFRIKLSFSYAWNSPVPSQCATTLKFTIESESSLDKDIHKINAQLVELGWPFDVSLTPDYIRNATRLQALLAAVAISMAAAAGLERFSECANLVQTVAFFDHYSLTQISDRGDSMPSVGCPVIRFKFGTVISDIDPSDESVNVHFSGGRHDSITCGGIVACVGFLQGKEANGIRVDDSGDVFANGVRLTSAMAAGQAVTGRGTVGESTAGLEMGIQRRLSSQKWISPNGDRWVSDRYPQAFTTDEVRMIQAAVRKGDGYTVSMEGLTQWQAAYRFGKSVMPTGSISYTAAASDPKKMAPPVSYDVVVGTLGPSGFSKIRMHRAEGVAASRSVKDTVNALLGDAIGGSCNSGSCQGCTIGITDIEDLSRFGLACLQKNSDVTRVFIPESPVLPHMVSNVSTHFKAQIDDRSSCGIGVHSFSTASPAHTQEILRHLARDRSRGAGIQGQGDGAGVVLSLDHGYFKARIFHEQKKVLPDRFGVIQIFADESDIDRIEERIKDRELEILATRKVPMNASNFHSPDRRHVDVYQIIVPVTDYTKNQLKEMSINAGSWLPNRYDLCSASTEWITYKLAGYSDELTVFEDLTSDQHYHTQFGLSHARFSTTTLPHPGRAHPHLGLIHNGEIQTKAAIIKWLVSKAIELKTRKIPMMVDVAELQSGSDSAVLQIYISALELLYPEYTLQEHLTLIFRSHNGNPAIVARGKSDGLPLVSGPCNMAMIGDEGEIVFVRAENGFRPATLVQSESDLSITSARYCPTFDEIQQVQEGAIISVVNGKVILDQDTTG